MKKPILYLETSLWSRLTDQADPRRRRISYAFLKWARRHAEIRISRRVRLEVNATLDLRNRRQVRRKIKAARPRTLTQTSEVRRIVDDLLSRHVLTQRHIEDLYHIGYSIACRADYLVTWDRDDLARESTRRRIEEYCAETGRKKLMIGTPEEVSEWLRS